MSVAPVRPTVTRRQLLALTLVVIVIGSSIAYAAASV